MCGYIQHMACATCFAIYLLVSSITGAFFGGYDNIVRRAPALGKALRAILYTAEKTPFRVFGLSHVLVLEKTGEG